MTPETPVERHNGHTWILHDTCVTATTHTGTHQCPHGRLFHLEP